jgi:glycosyltransferase involved in cell wall biosynthesis
MHVSTFAISNTGRELRGIWLAREIPFPLDSGDRVYSAQLAKALADAGAKVTFVGLMRPDRAEPPVEWPVRWMEVPGSRTGKLRALLSRMPLVAATHATIPYRRTVREILREEWDFIVVDQYGMGWVMEYLNGRLRRPVIVHVSHDHETSVTRALYRKVKGSAIKRAALWQNHLKTRRFERELARQADLVTAITPDDASLFSKNAPGLRTLVLSPGYHGEIVPSRLISSATPRSVVMVGSFHWFAKQENLRQFVAAADATFVDHKIELHVIGSMPQELAEELLSTARSLRLHGFAPTLAPYFTGARLAVVPEVIGGGFKLKFLNYIFNRVPVATLRDAAAGLPAEATEAMLCCDSLEALVKAIVTTIDDLRMLNSMQERAFHAAKSLFEWRDRGRDLLKAIESLRTLQRPS